MRKYLNRDERKQAIYDIACILINIHKAEVATASDVEALARKLAYIEDGHFFLTQAAYLEKARTHKRVYTWRVAQALADAATYEDPAQLMGWAY